MAPRGTHQLHVVHSSDDPFRKDPRKELGGRPQRLQQGSRQVRREPSERFLNALASSTDRSQAFLPSTTIMACTDSINDTLNALHATDDADQTTPVITLEYAPYMN